MRMKMILALGLMIQLAIACSMLKRTSKSTEDHLQQYELESRQKMEDKEERIKDTQLLTYSGDSTWHAYTLKLWPKGRLTYRIGNGFAGDFDSVVLSGNLKRINAVTTQSAVKQQVKSKLKAETIADVSLKIADEKLKVERMPDLRLVLVLIILVILTVFLVIKRQKS